MTFTRRRFLQGSAAAFAAPALSYRSIRGSNDDLRVAVVGIRSRGRQHIAGLHRLPGVRVVALCDADDAFLQKEAAAFHGREEPITLYKDYRDLLDDAAVDAVAIATPNHWHALMTIQACQAGKDVYVEKPVSHCVWEGRQMVKAARRYERIVQTGTQTRSNPGFHEAIAFVRGGSLGPIRLARGLCYKPRPSIGKVAAPVEPPSTVDYELWCGPAPCGPLLRRSLHYDWHWVWSTGNGDLGNQGIHQMDMCRFALGERALPRRVLSVGGRVGYDDDGETPNTMISLFDYERAPLLFEVRGLPDRTGGEYREGFLGGRIAAIIHCEEGHLLIDSYSSGVAVDRDGNEVGRWDAGGDHFANFVAAVRSRRVEDLTADIEEGHLSSALCHLGNVSLLRGRPAPAAELREALGGDDLGGEALARTMAHLAANGVDLDTTPLTLGADLAFDPELERFAGDREADALLRREYRAPFVVADEV